MNVRVHAAAALLGTLLLVSPVPPVLGAAAGPRTLRQTLADQQVTIQKLERLVEQQGELLKKLESSVTAGPVPAAAAVQSPGPAAAPVLSASPGPVPPAAPTGVSPEKKAIDAAKAEGLTIKIKYGDNLVGETIDGNHRIFVGGRLQLDGAFAHAPDALELGAGNVGLVQDAVNVRRARFDLGGTLFRNLDFYLQFDFVTAFNTERAGAPLLANTPQPTDLWMTFKNLPEVGNLRVGNQKEWLSFEHLISSRFLDFMERSSASDAFVEDQDNGFKMGLNVFNCSRDERTTWALGVFKNTRNGFASNVGDGEYVVTGRVSHTPIYKDNGRRLVHLAIGASSRDTDDGETRFRTRTLVRNGNNVQHTIVADARFLGERESRIIPELVVVHGPFTFQSEYFRAGVENATFPNVGGTFVGDVEFDGYYAQVMWFLTGEHKHYLRKVGAFGRVVPKRNAEWGPSALPGAPLGGAWMLAYRRGGVNLNDGPVQAGRVTDDTLGVNWFMNRDVKVQWNYTKTDRDAARTADGTIHSFGTRLAFDF